MSDMDILELSNVQVTPIFRETTDLLVSRTFCCGKPPAESICFTEGIFFEYRSLRYGSFPREGRCSHPKQFTSSIYSRFYVLIQADTIQLTDLTPIYPAIVSFSKSGCSWKQSPTCSSNSGLPFKLFKLHSKINFQEADIYTQHANAF